MMALVDKLSTSPAHFVGKPYNGAKKGPALGRAVIVGLYVPNAWGLHDMGGDDPNLSSVKDTMNRDVISSRVPRICVEIATRHNKCVREDCGS